MRLLSVEGAEEEEKELGTIADSSSRAGATKREPVGNAAACRRNGYVQVSGSFRIVQFRHGGPCSSHLVCLVTICFCF